MNRSRHSCCLSNILNKKSLCFVRSWQYGWSSNKSFLVWHYWVTPAFVIQSQGVFVLTSWHQPPLTKKKALLSWHHNMTSPLSNQEAHLWWRHSPPIKRTSHTIWYFSSHLGSEKTVMAFQCSLQWSEREGTHRRHERKCPERHRDGTAGEPAAVSLLTVNTAFEYVEETLVDVQVVHAGGQDQNAKERIAATRENVQSVNETEQPVNRPPCLSSR